MKILMYHQIVDGPPLNIHAVSRDQFYKQMRWLHASRYEVVGLDAAQHSSRSIVLTFDDAYEDFVDVALPILQEFGFTATVFVIAGLVGQTRVWSDGDDDSQPPLMDWDGVRAVQAAGCLIGSHTMAHPDLTAISAEALHYELHDSRQLLKQQLNEPILTLSYPYGRNNTQVQQIARDCGYEIAVASRPHYSGACGSNRHALDRIAVLATDSEATFAAKINGAWSQRKTWLKWRVRQVIG